MNPYILLSQTKRQRVSDGTVVPILSGCESTSRQLVLLWSRLRDFDSLDTPGGYSEKSNSFRQKES